MIKLKTIRPVPAGKRFWVHLGLTLVLLWCAACNPISSGGSPTVGQGATPTRADRDPTRTITALPSLTATLRPTAKPTFTLTPSPTASTTGTNTPTTTHTPEPLPIFTSTLLRGGVLPQSYLADACTYLRLRWSPEGSPPGTVVVPIMFHSIYHQGRNVIDPKDVSVDEFQAFVAYAGALGFETITTAQLRDFLLENARIPERAMILIVDDRRPGLIEEHFVPVLEANEWTLTAAYIADPYSLDWAWDWMERLYAGGRLDVQSHGYSGGLYITEYTPEEEIRAEILGSTAVLEARFGRRPIAFIWPGGNFTPMAVGIAREGGYQLGFTAYSRGPVLFNWVPLGEAERAVNDPLMVLPRAWSNSANVNLDQAVQIAEQARAEAVAGYETEASYYRAYCGGELPPLAERIPDSPDLP